MKKKVRKVCCDLCGDDITRAMKFYDRYGCRYCYECNEFLKGKYRKEKKKNADIDSAGESGRDNLSHNHRRLRRR